MPAAHLHVDTKCLATSHLFLVESLQQRRDMQYCCNSKDMKGFELLHMSSERSQQALSDQSVVLNQACIQLTLRQPEEPLLLQLTIKA